MTKFGAMGRPVNQGPSIQSRWGAAQGQQMSSGGMAETRSAQGVKVE